MGSLESIEAETGPYLLIPLHHAWPR